MTYLVLILSVLTGVLIVFSLKPGSKTIQLLLSFSGAYLLSITILHLLPEVFTASNNEKVGVFILVGLLLQLILDFFSKGAEHGHLHFHEHNLFPWALFISISIHSFMEGIPLAHSQNHEYLLMAIVVHKIPIAIILTTFFLNSNVSKKNAVAFILIFAMMSPLGSFAGEYIQIITKYKTEITSILIGIFLHISTIILFETSKDHKFNLLKFAAILIGMLVSFLA